MRNKILSFIPILLIYTSISAQKNDESWKVYDDSQIAVINITMDENDLQFMYENFDSDSMHMAAIHFQNVYIDEIIDSVGIRIRGNTSRESAKKSLKLSFNAFVNKGKFYSLEKMNLNGEHNDPSIVRSKLCWDFFNNIGVPSSRAAHAAVYINDKYYGLYISVEHIDEEFLQKNFADDSGNLWKCLFGADLQYLNSDPNSYKFEKGSRRSYDLIRNQSSDDYSQLERLINIVNNTSNQLLTDSLESVLNVNEFIKYLATNILTGSWDDYWSLSNNYYLYHEPSENKFHWIPYDYDNTFGVTWWTNIDWAKVNPYTFGKIYEGPRPLATKIMQTQKYRNLYTHFLKYYIENYFQTEAFTNRLVELKNNTSSFAEIDTFRIIDWGYTYEDFLNSYDQSGYYYENGVIIPQSIKDFVSTRISTLESQLSFVNYVPIIYQAQISSNKLKEDEPLFVTASVFSNKGLKSVKAQIEYDNQNVEFFEMVYNPEPKTLIVEEADRWTVEIPSLGNSKKINLKIIAEDLTGGISTYPTNGYKIISAGEVTKEVLLNELMSLNTSTIADPFSEFEDWIELYNPQDTAVNLSGKYLTDKINNLTKWKIPEGLNLQPKEYKLFWCDENQSQGVEHTNFKLSSLGEFLAIVDNDGITIIDSITFPSLKPDESFAREESETQNWFITSTSTPGQSNIITDVEDIIPQEFKIQLEAYPNPFNPRTTINYTIPNTASRLNSIVIIKVYDILGREVETIVNEKHKNGSYQIQYDASHLTSGIYFLKLQSGNLMKSIKLVLLR